MAIDAIKLSDFFKLVDKPKYILGTTYTLSLAFFESVVLPQINRTNLRGCVIICDSLGYHRALTEGAALQGAGQAYTVVPAPVKGSFHPKVWISVSDTDLAILVGSGNLTQSGFIQNAEYFDMLHFSEEAPPSEAVLDDIRSFVDGLTAMWSKEDQGQLICVELLRQIGKALSSFRGAGAMDSLSSVRLLHSFSGALHEALPEIEGCSDLYMAAPFFGGKSRGVDLLRTRYPDARLHLYPAIHSNGEVDLPVSQIRETMDLATFSTLSTPAKKQAFKHLKLYGFKGTINSWIYCTSANCTVAAWSGQNVEAGILRQVNPELLDEYFVSGTDKFTDAILKYTADDNGRALLKFWAKDSGGGVELRLSSVNSYALPLTGVTVTLRAGSNIIRVEKDSLFGGGPIEFFRWDSLDDSLRSRGIALCVEVEGADSNGGRVSGATFVDNHMMLMADPVQRSAFDGALALIQGDFIPNISNIAAIYALAGDLLNGEITKKVNTQEFSSIDKNETDTPCDSMLTAVWPPVPVHHESAKHISSSGGGQLQLCQRIMEMFFKPEQGVSRLVKGSASLGVEVDDEDEELSDAQVEAKKSEGKMVDRMWKRAERDYEKLHRRLNSLEPRQEQAGDLLSAAVFVFLATLAVRRSAAKHSDTPEQMTNSGTITSDFRRLMLNERDQGKSFCCSQGMRYRDVKFPSLIDDLRNHFKVQVHEDMSVVMLAIIAEEKMGGYSRDIFDNLCRRWADKVCGTDFVLTEPLEDRCVSIWRDFIQDEESKASEDNCREVLRDITRSGEMPK